MTSTPSRLPRVTLADQVRDYIVLEIAQGRMKLGTPLRELEIAERLGTSQTPVREAFRELAMLGVLESRVHVGTRVRHVALQDLVDAIPVRAALEEVAGHLAAPRLKDNTAEISDAFSALQEIALTGDRLAYANASTEFHRAIVRAAKNDSLLRAWNALGIEVMTIMTMASNDMDLVPAAESHRVIVEALESGDAELAGRMLGDHLAGYLPEPLRSEALSAVESTGNTISPRDTIPD